MADGKLRGAALIIVLAFLVIITGLVVAFLSSITNEAASTSAAASAITTRSLADAAIQLDIAQIRDATAGYARNSDGSLNSSSPVCWASQPGAIRTYDTNAAPVSVYRLYSATNMVATNAPSADLPSSTSWVSNSAFYTDLNAPVITTRSGVTYTNYPIMDPMMTNTTNGSPVIEGFSISSNAAMSGLSNPAPMPVTWLYMLKDGTIIAPDAGSTTNATFSSAAKQPASNNPIVGRIAFWTDDETCKLNINTASEGSYWATPSFSTSMDVYFGSFPPYAGEYNRYPGHPASTSLSPVLWSFFNLTNPSVFVSGLPGVANGYNLANGTMTPGDATANVQAYLSNVLTQVSPRYAWGGSFAGRKSPFTNLLGSSLLGSPIARTNLSKYRLYSSVDEMFYAPTNSTGATNGRLVNSFITNSSGSFSISPQQVSALRFFLTTASRAPEVNPLNLPKITMWPVPSTNNTMTANTNSKSASATRTLTDQTIAFCSTLGTNPYYFTRYNAASTTADYSARNATLFQFLTNQMSLPIPGFNGAFIFGNKWSGAQGSQIATEIYDYIRSCINLCDSTGITNFASVTASNYAYSYTTPPQSNSTVNLGSGQVLPISIGSNKGIGRFPTMRGAALWFIARAANQPPLMVSPATGRPLVYDASGNQISSDGSLSQTVIANLITSTNYMVYARVNPMHPWITPPSAGGTWCGQTIINVAIGSSNVTLIPILRYTNGFGTNYPGSTNCPVFAMTINTNSVTNDPAIANQLFPIFDLTQTNPIANNTGQSFSPCRSYPCIDTSVDTYTGAGKYCFTYADTNSNNLVAFVTGNTTNYFCPATIVGFSPTTNGYNYSSIPTNPSGSIQTHPGLRYLSLQVPSGATAGQFSSNNPYFFDTNQTSLNYYETRMEMAYVPDLVNVAPGQMALFPNMQVSVANLTSLKAGGSNLNFISNNALITWTSVINSLINSNYFPSYDLGISFYMNAKTNTAIATNIVVSGETFPFDSGGTAIQNQIYGNATNTNTLVQTVNIMFPAANFPTPKLYNFVVSTGKPGQIYPPVCAQQRTQFGAGAPSGIPGTGDMPSSNFFKFSGSINRISMCANYGQEGIFAPEMMINAYNNSGPTYFSGYLGIPWMTNGLDRITCDTIQAVDLIYSDPRFAALLASVPTNCFAPNPLYGNSNPVNVSGWISYIRAAHSLRSFTGNLNGGIYGSFLCSGTNGTTGTNSYFYPPMYEGRVPSIQGSIGNYTAKTNIFSWSQGRSINSTWYGSYNGGLIVGGSIGHNQQPYAGADCDFSNAGFFTLWKNGGDFDNGIGNFPDGPFINKADEGVANYGTTNNPYFGIFGINGSSLFSANRMVPSPVIFGSLPVLDRNWDPANPSATLTNSSWRTLQFSPNPNAMDTNGLLARNASAGYNAAGSLITNTILPDHLLLDFFQMPVVEPYPISDPFSTAGKVNMNYQIAPFSYINRDTALRGALKSLMITAVDDQWGYDYKFMQTTFTYGSYYSDSTKRMNPSGVANSQDYNSFGSNSGNFYFHYPVQATETLRQFTNRFGQNDLFHSPSEICSLWLYPAKQPTSANPTNNTVALTSWDSASANIMNWWYGSPGVTRKSLTGDNIRERPYAYLYPRLTTKSNTYQIHYRVQTLKQTPTAHSSDWSQWIDPAAAGITDKVLGEQRGSAVIERYMDPSDPNLPDFAASTNSAIMDSYYRFRVFNAKTFTP